jgi:hypothetical protein
MLYDSDSIVEFQWLQLPEGCTVLTLSRDDLPLSGYRQREQVRAQRIEATLVTDPLP